MSFNTSSASDGRRPQSGLTGQVCIVGCGPSGCYTALALLRLAPEVNITVFDARPTPFGLIRYGVAPDHQGMKNVSRQFDRLFASDRVEFVGNTVVGRDLSVASLQESFDVVVIATGLPQDRPLNLPIDPRARVYGAGQLLRLLNSDPDSMLRSVEHLTPLGQDILIVGAGNVAMDVARLLCKADDGFHGSDVDDEAREALQTEAVHHLTVLCRGPRERVRWDPSMFSELLALDGVSVFMDGDVIDNRPAAGDAVSNRRVRVDVRFNEEPVAIDVVDEQCLVRTRRTSEGAATEFLHEVDTVVTAMGFVDAADGAFDVAGERVIRVGGCGSGTLGNLAENRTLAKAAAQQIFESLRENQGRPGLSGVRNLCPPDSTTFEDWTNIDRAEAARARPDRLRTKFTSWSAMADVVSEHRGSTSGDGGGGAAPKQ